MLKSCQNYYRFRLVFALLVVLLASGRAAAQDTLTLTATPIDTTLDFLNKQATVPPRFSQKTDLIRALNTLVTELQSKGFLTASVDSLLQEGNHFEAFVFIGKKYRWAHLRNGNVTPFFLSKIGFRQKIYDNKPFDYAQVVQLKNALLDYCENNGYPFATVQLRDVTIEGEAISAAIFLDKGPLIRINSIELVAPLPNISVGYLENYLDLKEGDLYDEAKIKAIRKRLQELPFLKERRSLQVIFIGNSAKIYLFLDKKKASQFDFLVGFLPQNEETGRLTFTGNVQLFFQNALGRGEIFDLKWQQLRPLTPRLDLRMSYPYILNLPLGADIDFHLYRRDTTYLDVNYRAGVQYLLEGGNYVKAFFDNFQTNILTINEAQILNTRQLPRNLDVQQRTFGLEWQLQRLDYRFNPRKGLSLLLKSGAGIKTIEVNNLIAALKDENNPDFDFTSLYAPLPTRSLQLRLQGEIAYFVPLGGSATIKFGLKGGGVFTQDSVYQNELYRIGGNQLLRGFDEESIFAELYSIGTIEARLLTAQNAYLFMFLDYGYALQRLSTGQVHDFPLGFGLGMTLQAGSGVLTFSVAVGRQLNNPLNFQATKIHIGFVNFF